MTDAFVSYMQHKHPARETGFRRYVLPQTRTCVKTLFPRLLFAERAAKLKALIERLSAVMIFIKDNPHERGGCFVGTRYVFRVRHKTAGSSCKCLTGNDHHAQ